MVDKIVSHEQAREAALHDGKAEMPFRGVILQKAMNCTLGDRQDAYGPPSNALFLAAEMLRLYKYFAKEKYCAAHDQSISLAILKLARIACGAVGHNDNYVDGAAYFAIAAECQHEHKPGSELAKWCAENDFLSEDRLKKLDEKYKSAVELEHEDKRDRGMVNSYAPVNKLV